MLGWVLGCGVVWCGVVLSCVRCYVLLGCGVVWCGVVDILWVDVFYFEGGGPTVGFVCREQVKTLWTGVLVNIMFDR